MSTTIWLSGLAKECSEELFRLLELLEDENIPATARANLKVVENNLSACLNILRKIL